MKENKEMRKLKNKYGITLVALVVTIVVLIILATISINIIFGEEGIVERVKQAKQDMANSQKEEEQILEDTANSIDGYIIGEREQITVDKEEYENLKAQTEKLIEEVDNLKTTVSALSGMENIKTYRGYSTNTFEDISLETGDYLCILSTYGSGAINTKPSEYIISLGEHYYENKYYANYYQMVNGSTTYTITLSPKTETNPNGTLSIKSSTTGYHQCILIKLDNGHT